MEIISERKQGIQISRQRSFHYKDDKGSGFSFDVDDKGQVINKNEAAAKNYAMCLTGMNTNGEVIIDDGIIEYKNRYTECAVGKCSCGELVYLDGFTNECRKCSADYNMSGQRLAPREQWGEETGEHPADIARIR